MFAALARDFRLAPVTFSLLALSVVLFFGVECYRTFGNDPLPAGRTFGSVVPLTLHFQGEVQLHGPLDLWERPWWRWLRVPASAFHHANLLHLVCNVSLLWYLGPLLERRMRVWKSLLFWFFAAMVPLLPEFLLENYAVGLSGVGCAMFGWCLVERHWDPVVAQRVHPGMVQWTWMFLVGCLVATILGVLQIANIAHFVGVGYGWLIARMSQSRRGRWGFLAAHALLPVLVYGVLHPFWNGRYHAHRGWVIAERASSFTPAVPEFREAVRLEPGLPLIWARLADERAKQGDRLGAWRFIIAGLQHNQSNQPLTEGAQRIWRFLTPTEREEARRALEQTFAGEAEKWSKRLKLSAEPLADTPRDSLQFELDRLKNEIKTLTVDPSDPSSPARRGRKPSKRHVDPDAPGSAAEGRTL